MKYEKITADQVIAALDQRLAQLEQEHLAHEINKVALSSLPAGPEKTAALKHSDDAQSTLDTAWTAVKADIAARRGPGVKR